jgi:hypothetical protein
VLAKIAQHCESSREVMSRWKLEVVVQDREGLVLVRSTNQEREGRASSVWAAFREMLFTT